MVFRKKVAISDSRTLWAVFILVRNTFSLCLLLAPLEVLIQAGEDSITLGTVRVHPTRILARFTDHSASSSRITKLAALGLHIEHWFEFVPGLIALKDDGPALKQGHGRLNEKPAGDRLLGRIRQFRELGIFDYVEPDYIVAACREPNDARFVDDTLWGLRNRGTDGGSFGADIDAVRAWDITTGSTNVIVAVIDSGIRYTHRDLALQMWRNPNEIPGNGIDDDGDGYVDDVFGINAANNSGDPVDEYGHGTHIAGTIGAAANDGNPHVGVAWNVRLMACRFLGSDGFGLTSDAIRCIDYAVSKGARIINASWVGGASSSSLYDAVARAKDRGVLFVAAAGNDGSDLDSSPGYPASFGLDNIISVAALDRRDQLASFSNFGKSIVHLGAPGVEIHSTSSGSDQAYISMDGTSMAAPYVSGVAALILARSGYAAVSEIRNRILSTVIPVESLRRKTRTGGRLNAFGALTAIPTGKMELSLVPDRGADLRAGSIISIEATVTDLAEITNATVSARIDGSDEILNFQRGKSPPDQVESASRYFANLLVPNDRTTLTLQFRVNAPEKSALIETVNYAVDSPPLNDDFVNATIVPAAGGYFTVTNRLASLESGEPLHAHLPSCSGSVWWRWAPTISGSVIVDTAGSSFDAVLAVYTNATLQSLKEVGSPDDSGAKTQSYVRFDAVGSVAYFIAVASRSPSELGVVHLRVQPRGAPDDHPPDVAIISPLSGFTVTNALDNRIVIAGIAADPEPNSTGVEEILVQINGQVAGRAFGTTVWSSTNALEVGENTIKVLAVDFAHNSSSTRPILINYRPLLSPNDLFANSVELVGRQGQVKMDNGAATKEYGEPQHAGAPGGKSVWWHYRPTSDGLLKLSTENSSFDTVLAVYTGSRVTNLVEISNNDNSRPGVTFSEIRQAVKKFETYCIAVDGKAGDSGAVSLSYSFTPVSVYHLSLSNSAGGIVSLISGYYEANARVIVSAASAPNFQFEGWSGTRASIENPIIVVMTNDVELIARFAPYDFSDGFESGGLKRLHWTSAGDAPWVVQNQVVAFGQFAARSGSIRDGRSSLIILTEKCRAGTGAFDLRVSSEEGWDFLEFALNGRRVQRWSGDVPWFNYQFNVLEGTNIFEWRYSKDPGGTSVGMDAGFIDNLELPLTVGFDATTSARLEFEFLDADKSQLQIWGQKKQQYVIQRSEDLRSWLPFSTNIATNGIIRLIDPRASNPPARFFRAISP